MEKDTKNKTEDTGKPSFGIVGLEELDSLDDEDKKEKTASTESKKYPETPIFGLPEMVPQSAKKDDETVVGIKKIDEKPTSSSSQDKSGWPYVCGEDKPSDAIMEMIAGIVGEDESQPKTLEEINASRKKKS